MVSLYSCFNFVIMKMVLHFVKCIVSKRLKWNFKTKVLRNNEVISGKCNFILGIKLFV